MVKPTLRTPSFALTDEQKDLAENYAENLSLFLGDGLFQYAPSTNTTTALGDVRLTDGETEVIYFNQLDERYANQPYGTDHIGGLWLRANFHGYCGFLADRRDR